MDFFAEKYKRLNKEQKLAVDTIDGPVMVIAGPGTGKTTILTLRIANILRKTDTPPSGILAITFTDAGVKSMKMKLREIVGTVADQVRIHTFHSFASSIISEFQEHFAHLSGSNQLNEIDSEEMIRKILNDLSMKDDRFDTLRPIGNTDFYIKHILGAISKAKNEAYMPDMIRDFAENEIKKIKSDDTNISTRGATKGELKAEAKKRIEKCEKTILFSEIYEIYEDKKRKAKKVDYDDLIIEVLSALESDQLLLRLVQEKFLYILIDEHQDSNDSQNLLVSLIAEFFEVPNVFIVGDEKQAIYRFQGASVQNFLRFRNAWPDMKLINLKDNYRSHQSILDASHSMIEANYRDGEYKELRTKLISGAKTYKVRPIDIVTGMNNISIENYLVEQLKSIMKNKDETVAIITRTNRELENILRILESNNIKASAVRNIDIFKHPLAVIYFNLLDFLIDPTNLEALSKTLVAGLWDLSFEDMIVLIRTLRSKTFSDHESSIARQENSYEKNIFDIYIPKLKYILGQINSEDIVGFLKIPANDFIFLS
jgi:DNA helicase-2/ATP-dependent DNA helicase PcrA